MKISDQRILLISYPLKLTTRFLPIGTFLDKSGAFIEHGLILQFLAVDIILGASRYNEQHNGY